jgi:hypothetical protein
MTRRMSSARWGSSPQTEEAWTVSTSWQPLSPVLVVAEGAAPHRQMSRLTLPKLAKKLQNPIAFQVGVRYYADKPEGGPDWGLRFVTTLLFPK